MTILRQRLDHVVTSRMNHTGHVRMRKDGLGFVTDFVMGNDVSLWNHGRKMNENCKMNQEASTRDWIKNLVYSPGTFAS